MLRFIFPIQLLFLLSAIGAAQQSACFFESTEVAYDQGLFGSATGDLDGDGDLDLVTYRTDGEGVPDTMIVLSNDGKGNFSETSSFNNPIFSTTDPKLGDMDNDGDLDVVLAMFNARRLYVFFNDGSGNFANPQIIPYSNQPIESALGDIDADGDLDVVVTMIDGALSPGFVLVYENDGTGLIKLIETIDTFVFPSEVLVMDVTSDGNPDIVLTARCPDDFGEQAILVYPNDGNGNFADAIISDSNEFGSSLNPVDLNEDGIVDLAISDFSDGTTIMYGNGDGTYQPPQPLIPGDSYRPFFGFLDVDSDGDLDLIALEAFVNTTNLFLNNGDGTFTRDLVVSFAFSPNRIPVGDFNGDGTLDVSISHSGGVQKTLFFTCQPTLFGDINLDGKVDLLDVNPFVDLLSNGIYQIEADIARDNVVDLLDIAPFVELLSN